MGLIEQESIGPLNLYNRLDAVNPPLKDDLAKVGVRYEAGYLYPPSGPGLGVELNEEIIPSIITPGKSPTLIS
jgi:L-alanine-DL-glutamate epimerase-like enolase superfamily enzyme